MISVGSHMTRHSPSLLIGRWGPEHDATQVTVTATDRIEFNTTLIYSSHNTLSPGEIILYYRSVSLCLLLQLRIAKLKAKFTIEVTRFAIIKMYHLAHWEQMVVFIVIRFNGGVALVELLSRWELELSVSVFLELLVLFALHTIFWSQDGD